MVTCAAGTRNTAAMAMPAVPAAAHDIAMFRSGTYNPPPVALAVVGPRVLSATDDDGPAFFAHFAKSVSHVAPPEDAAIVAVVVVAVVVVNVIAVVVVTAIVVAVVAVVVVAIANAVIEFPIIVVLIVLLHTAPSLMSLFPPVPPLPSSSFPSRQHCPSP
jgi:hypothetical protein